MPADVLILEDSKTQAIIISKMFQRAGLTTVCVTTPDDAMDQLRSQPFGLLVLDVFVESRNTLDDLGGYRELAPDVPIAVMTAGQINNPDAGAEALNKARRARVNFLLPKPFYFDDVKQICEDVEAYWKKSQGSTDAAASEDDEALFRSLGLTPGLFNLTQKSEDLVALMAKGFARMDAGRIDDFKAISDAIAQARREIRDLRPIDVSQKDLPAAGAELDAITLDTETATHVIMSAAERILDLGSDDAAAKAAIDDQVMHIFEACSFQDITGQRVSKIVRLLTQIETRMIRLVTSLGIQEDGPVVLSPEEQRRRDLILNGPAIGGPETAQAEIDSMFNSAHRFAVGTGRPAPINGRSKRVRP
ncbi:MAG: protein phosphatase CheZ [Asticcacaulis sp.]|nr:protein phosphatase CheZ [Asticcacaulis sp.]